MFRDLCNNDNKKEFLSTAFLKANSQTKEKVYLWERLILLKLNISHYLGTGEHVLIYICSNDIKEQRMTSLFILLI